MKKPAADCPGSPGRRHIRHRLWLRPRCRDPDSRSRRRGGGRTTRREHRSAGARHHRRSCLQRRATERDNRGGRRDARSRHELESDLCRYRRRSSGGIFAGSPDPLHRTQGPRGPRRCRPRPRDSPGRGWASVRVRLHRSRIPVRTLQRRFDTFSQEPCERLHPCPARRSPAPEKRDRHPDHRHGLRSTDSRRMRAAHS